MEYREYLFGKQGVALPLNRTYPVPEVVARVLHDLNVGNDPHLITLVEDLLHNRHYYRSSVTPRYDFDVPFDDFRRFLQLDGWEETDRGTLQKSESEIIDTDAEEDALLVRLRASGLTDAALIETHLNRAAEEYGRDNNNSMTNSRQALEQLLMSIATATAQQRGDAVPVANRVRDYLQVCGFFTEEEKRGFSGAYGFLNGGPHPGIVDQEATRLGRNFALGSCHYALQKFARWVLNGFRGF